jgi:hypothetical protein
MAEESRERFKGVRSAPNLDFYTGLCAYSDAVISPPFDVGDIWRFGKEDF